MKKIFSHPMTYVVLMIIGLSFTQAGQDAWMEILGVVIVIASILVVGALLMIAIICTTPDKKKIK